MAIQRTAIVFAALISTALFAASSTGNDGPQPRTAAQRALAADETGVGVATPTTYSQWFEADKDATRQCNVWREWLPTIGSGFTSVTWSGSIDSVGVTCSDLSAVAIIADGMRSGRAFNVHCDGHEWTMCNRFEGELWLDPPSPCDTANCPHGYLLRPCFNGAAFWGAVNGPTCGGAPSQQITVAFE